LLLAIKFGQWKSCRFLKKKVSNSCSLSVPYFSLFLVHDGVRCDKRPHFSISQGITPKRLHSLRNVHLISSEKFYLPVSYLKQTDFRLHTYTHTHSYIPAYIISVSALVLRHYCTWSCREIPEIKVVREYTAESGGGDVAGERRNVRLFKTRGMR